MRQPIMAALLLMLCFPLKGVVVMLVAAGIGRSAMPPSGLPPMVLPWVQIKICMIDACVTEAICCSAVLMIR